MTKEEIAEKLGMSLDSVRGLATPEQVADILGVKTTAVQGWCRLKMIKCVQIIPGGTLYRIYWSEVVRLKEEQDNDHS